MVLYLFKFVMNKSTFPVAVLRRTVIYVFITWQVNLSQYCVVAFMKHFMNIS